ERPDELDRGQPHRGRGHPRDVPEGQRSGGHRHARGARDHPRGDRLRRRGRGSRAHGRHPAPLRDARAQGVPAVRRRHDRQALREPGVHDVRPAPDDSDRRLAPIIGTRAALGARRAGRRRGGDVLHRRLRPGDACRRSRRGTGAGAAVDAGRDRQGAVGGPRPGSVGPRRGAREGQRRVPGARPSVRRRPGRRATVRHPSARARGQLHRGRVPGPQALHAHRASAAGRRRPGARLLRREAPPL
ncbi:MAG: Dienelactone hydrolase family protein, partial [uncultured Nocardioidaceae bacterium]